MKKFFNEFKAFISRGNVIDMAVGVIIGGAFQAIVTALTDDFIMGMDISSAPSLIDAGVVYGDWDGNALDGDDSQAKLDKFVQFLADNGITHVRVRIWNDPKDADGNGYGGGNCDVSNAVRIAKACAGAGVGMLIDFHYSDFWADPGRQLVPKAWRNYDSDLKEAELGDFTAESLLTIAQTGAQIDMVQVGNETTSGIAGTSSSDIPGMCRLFSEGSMGVRAFSEIQYGNAAQVKVVIHVTNPESGNMTTWAKRLADNNVDYDVLATSYYPYWHGTLANLKNQMKTVKDTYGKNVMVALREPSMGPVFGIKGGAAGGGYAQVVPMEDINLHFTGDLHAIGTANNLLAAMIDNSIQQGNPLNIDPRRVTWKRCMDMNDRQLRFVVDGLGGKANGTPREDGFDITVASEVMACFCLASDILDLKERLARIIVGYTYDEKPVTAGDVGAVGAMTALLKDALKPNLVQTLEGTPAFVHGGPFANIAHGCNSVTATKMALKLADYTLVHVIAEDLGIALGKAVKHYIDNTDGVYGFGDAIGIIEMYFLTI